MGRPSAVTLPSPLLGAENLMRVLRKHQRPMLRYLMCREYGALFVEMRLGKTLVVIRRMKMTDAKLILVVAPYSALAGWERELHLEGEVDVAILTGSREQRMNRLREAHRWNLINKEGRLVVPEIAQVPWDAVILDESTFIKAPPSRSKKTNRPNTSRFFTQNFRSSTYRIILTGTPAPESETDYYQQLAFLDPDILGYQSYWHFRERCFVHPPEDVGGHMLFCTMLGKEYISKRLAEHAFFLKRREVDMGGEKVYETRTVRLPEKVRKVYETVEKEFVLEVDGETESTIWATQKFIWLRRICGGAFKELHMEKLDVLTELLQGELRNEQVVIWAVFLEEIAAICDHLREGRIPVEEINGSIRPAERESRRQRFFTGELRALVCQPECFRHGTDLSCSATAIYYSTPLGLETRQQSEDRIVDVSRRDPLLILDLIVENSVEESILRSLMRKERRGSMMRRMVEEVRCRSRM